MFSIIIDYYILLLLKFNIIMNYILSIYDTLTKKKKYINLVEKKKSSINLYVCGITPYDSAHVGHARCYVSYDILVRLVRYFGYQITYVQNITDVNDKIFLKAVDYYNDVTRYKEIADFYHNEFQNSLLELACLSADYYPRVSDSIDDIIHLIKKIIYSGHAYETDDGVYFNVNSYKKYGELSQRLIVDDNNISRINDLYFKNTEFDFVLWKKNNSGVCWDSPWGKGLPGWHIECSAMVRKSFGEVSLDIHGGGMDLLFPHHENEKAQSECCLNYPLSNIWMHVAFINVNKEKMSKSSGNSFYLKDIMNSVNPMVFRLYLLMHHFGSPIEFELSHIIKLEDVYNNLISLFNINEEIDLPNNYNHYLLKNIYTLLLDNLNTAAVIGLVFKNKLIINSDKLLKAAIKNIFQYILGLSLEKIKKNFLNDDFIKNLILQRELERKNKNFVKADAIRLQLLELGINIQDDKI